MPLHQPSGTEPEVALAYDLFPGDPDAPVLAYCHGLFSSRQGFRAEMIRRWCAQEHWTWLGFDFRGRGDSSGSLQDLTLTHHIEDVDAILDVLPQGTRPVLFGSSLGGLAAAWYAALNPDRVRSCVLVAPAFSIVADLLRDAGPEGRRQWKRDGKLHLKTERIDLELDHAIVEDQGDYPMELLYEVYETPTLIAHGRNDAVIPCTRSLDFARRVAPGLVDLHLFANGDHQLHAHMEAIMMLVERFVS
jgi:uncharacterized protein